MASLFRKSTVSFIDKYLTKDLVYHYFFANTKCESEAEPSDFVEVIDETSSLPTSESSLHLSLASALHLQNLWTK